VLLITHNFESYALLAQYALSLPEKILQQHLNGDEIVGSPLVVRRPVPVIGFELRLHMPPAPMWHRMGIVKAQ